MEDISEVAKAIQQKLLYKTCPHCDASMYLDPNKGVYYCTGAFCLYEERVDMNQEIQHLLSIQQPQNPGGVVFLPPTKARRLLDRSARAWQLSLAKTAANTAR